jgi:hypothetical protein
VLSLPGRAASGGPSSRNFGGTDDERDLEAGVERGPLRTRHARAVIAVVHDDRVARETGRFQLGQPLAGDCVHHGELIVVLRPVLVGLADVGHVGRHGGLRDVVHPLVRPRAQL